MDIESAKKYSTEEYYSLLLDAKFAGIIPIMICPEVIATMKPIVRFEDRKYKDAHGTHILRTVWDGEGSKAYVDATNIEIVEKVHPNLIWHLAFSLQEVIVSYISPTELFAICTISEHGILANEVSE